MAPQRGRGLSFIMPMRRRDKQREKKSYWVRLTPAEMAYAEAIGRARNRCHRSANRGDRAFKKSASVDIDIMGAQAEKAVAKFLRQPWDGSFKPLPEWMRWRVEGHDVGPFEVRATDWRYGRLLMQPDDPPFSPFLLVIAADRPLFQMIGWIFGREGKEDMWLWDAGYGFPCYYVPRHVLRPVRDLKLLQQGTRLLQETG